MAGELDFRSQETAGSGENPEQAAARRLDDATFEPQALVEQTGDYRQSEAIQENFSALVDNAANRTAETSGKPADQPGEPDSSVPGTEVVGVFTPNRTAEASGKPADQPGEPDSSVPGTEAVGVFTPNQKTGEIDRASVSEREAPAAGIAPAGANAETGFIKSDAVESVEDTLGPKSKKYYKEVGGWDFMGAHLPGVITEYTNEYADLKKPGSTAGDSPVNEPVDENIGPKSKKYYKEVGGLDFMGAHLPGTITEYTNEYADLKKPGSTTGEGQAGEPADEPIGKKAGGPTDLQKPGSSVVTGQGGEMVDEKIGSKPKKYYKEVGGWDFLGMHIPGTMTEYTNEYADLKKPGSTAGEGQAGEPVDEPIGKKAGGPTDLQKPGSFVVTGQGGEMVDEKIGSKPKKYYKEVGGWDFLGMHIPGTMTEYTNEYADLKKPGSTESEGQAGEPVDEPIGKKAGGPTDLQKPGSSVVTGQGGETVDEKIGSKPKKYYKEVGGWDFLGMHIPGTMTEYTNEYADLQKPGSTISAGEAQKPELKPRKPSDDTRKDHPDPPDQSPGGKKKKD